MFNWLLFVNFLGLSPGKMFSTAVVQTCQTNAPSFPLTPFLLCVRLLKAFVTKAGNSDSTHPFFIGIKTMPLDMATVGPIMS